MWTLVIAASVTIQYNQLETSLFLVNLLFIYQIFVNWKLVRLRNPIFNDGVWFDDPPRGWDFWYVSRRQSFYYYTSGQWTIQWKLQISELQIFFYLTKNRQNGK